MQQPERLDWGYILYNGKVVPHFDTALTASAVQVIEWIERTEKVHRV